MHVRHPMLRPESVEFRGYQANLARIAQGKDTLVVLPTGMGKTVIALLCIADALQQGAQRILMLAPTRPLVEQHARSFSSLLAEPWSERVQALTGNQTPERRAEAYAKPGLVIATPQVIQNDLMSGALDLAQWQWVIFDESHRAVGDYPYVLIGRELQRKAPQARRLGLTASPGHNVAKTEEVRQNLGLTHVEIRTPGDADVAQYVQQVAMEWEALPLPPTMARVSQKLGEALTERIKAIKHLGFLKEAGSRPTRRDLLELSSHLSSLVQKSPNPDPSYFSALSLQAQALKLNHAIEQVETQGAAALVEYLESVRGDAAGAKPSKASQSVANDPRVNEAYHIARLDGGENPKMGRVGVLVQEALEKDREGRIIVFTHYRTTCEAVVGHLSKLPGVKPVLFVGQSKRGDQDGMTQKQQGAVLEEFKAGNHNVLVATSVAEEGLDIPEVDLVVFFEPIPSEIRAIQRRGRTGRKRAGRVVVLMTKGTRDEAYHWASRRKEQEMVRELHQMRAVLATREASGAVPLAPAPMVQRTLSGPDQTTEPTERAETKTGSVGSVSSVVSPPKPAGPTNPNIGSVGSVSSVVSSATLAAPVRIRYDQRERATSVVRDLHVLGATLEPTQLEVGDYILSDRIAVERKSGADFVDSLLDGRLFDQLRALKAYPRPFLVIEGEGLYGHRNVSAEALWGAIASVATDYGVAIIQVRDAAETARFLFATAKREQHRADRKMALRHKPPMSDAEQQRFLVAGLPNVSDILATRLLDHFGSPAGVFAATVRELAEIDGIGPEKASAIRTILDTSYEAKRRRSTKEDA